MALLVTRANVLGRKPLLLLAFAALPLRGGLCIWFDNPSWLLAVQVLDGVGGGLFDALLPLVLADIMAGPAITASLAAWSAQFRDRRFVEPGPRRIYRHNGGYNAAFLTLAMVATAGLLLIIIAMPETTPSSKGSPS